MSGEKSSKDHLRKGRKQALNYERARGTESGMRVLGMRRNNDGTGNSSKALHKSPDKEVYPIPFSDQEAEEEGDRKGLG